VMLPGSFLPSPALTVMVVSPHFKVTLAALFTANLGRPRAVRAVAWEAVGFYWHFVDAVWVVVFTVVYLGTLL